MVHPPGDMLEIGKVSQHQPQIDFGRSDTPFKVFYNNFFLK
jgi:hypothetical protein